VKLITFNGKDAIDIREHYDVQGEPKPTRKGVFIPIEHISELVNLVEQAEAKYNEFARQEKA
jgi:hypothetical protein